MIWANIVGIVIRAVDELIPTAGVDKMGERRWLYTMVKQYGLFRKGYTIWL